VRTVLDPYAGGNDDLEMSVDGLEFELGAGRESELISKRLGNHQAACRVDGGSHGRSLPLQDGDTAPGMAVRLPRASGR